MNHFILYNSISNPYEWQLTFLILYHKAKIKIESRTSIGGRLIS